MARPARLTFRPIVAGGPAWQRQLRDRFTTPAPTAELELGTSIIRPVSRALAESVILRYEWLGTLPKATRYFGIFFGPYLAGVTAVSVGNGTAGAFTSRQYGIEGAELATLTRGACVHWAPPGTNSRLVSWTVRLLRALEPRAKLLVAYADTEAGEIGTIYQACGWTYVGPGSRVREWVTPSGAVVNHAGVLPRAMPRRGRGRFAKAKTALELGGWRLQLSNPKLRYVVVLDRDDLELVGRIRRMRLPYPKRPTYNPRLQASEANSDDAPAYQVGEDARSDPLAP
jgi:hypothetical protein